MREGDETRFFKVLNQTLEVTTGARVSEEALDAWWEDLLPFSIEHVEAALRAHRRQSVYAPKPADVIKLLSEADGRPGAEEAWGIALAASDETATVVWTEEIATAKTACDELLAEGDEVAARMAFKERYEREVRDARARQRPVRWHASLGHDPDQRIGALRQAYEQGRIGASTVHHHLPKLTALEVAGPVEVGDQRLLTDERADHGDTERIDDETARENLRALRELVSGSNPEPELTYDPGVVDRTRAWGADRSNPSTDEAASAAEE